MDLFHGHYRVKTLARAVGTTYSVAHADKENPTCWLETNYRSDVECRRHKEFVETVTSTIHVDFHAGTLRIRGIDGRRLKEFPFSIRHDDRDDCFRCDAMWAAPLKSLLADHFRVDQINWHSNVEVEPPGSLSMTDRRTSRLRGDQDDAIQDFEAGGR